MNANLSIQKLILQADGLVLKEIIINEKQNLKIGRKSINDIQIDNIAISGEHALITNFGEEVFIEDLDSTNGIQVNGRQTRRVQLKDNDSIAIGKYSLKYVLEADPSSDDNLNANDAVAWDPSKIAEVAAGLNSQNEVRALSSQQISVSMPSLESINIGTPSIRVVKGMSKGKGMELIKHQTTLGRPGQLVVLIIRESDGYYLQHHEGNLRSTINGEEMLRERQRLEAGDIINVAGSEIEFYFKT